MRTPACARTLPKPERPAEVRLKGVVEREARGGGGKGGKGGGGDGGVLTYGGEGNTPPTSEAGGIRPPALQPAVG